MNLGLESHKRTSSDKLKPKTKAHLETTGKKTLRLRRKLQHPKSLSQMLEIMETRWNGDLERINVVKHCIQLERFDRRLVHSTPFHAVFKARELEKEESYQILAENVIEPAQTKQASSFPFDPKKYGSIRFCVEYCKRVGFCNG